MILDASGRAIARTARHRLTDAEVADVRANDFESKVEIVVTHRRLPYLSATMATLAGCERRPDYNLQAVIAFCPADARTVHAVEGFRKNLAQAWEEAFDRQLHAPGDTAPNFTEPTTDDAVMAIMDGTAL